MKNIVFKVLLLFTFSFGGCCGQKCRNANIHDYYDINGFSVSLYDKKVGAEYYTLYENSSPVLFDQVYIMLKAEMTYLGDIHTNDKNDWTSFFSNAAYACSCVEEGSKGSLEEVSDILIFSDSVFVEGGNTSDTLSKYFTIGGLDGEFRDIPPTDLVSYISTKPHPLREYDLHLKTKPTGSQQHAFTIIYKQTNGESYTIKTSQIVFKP